LLKARLLKVEGRLQRAGLVIHIVAEKLVDETWRLAALTDTEGPGRDPPSTRAGEVKRPVSVERQNLTRHPRRVNPLPPSRDFR
jgi:error-prone DNA polymerase